MSMIQIEIGNNGPPYSRRIGSHSEGSQLVSTSKLLFANNLLKIFPIEIIVHLEHHMTQNYNKARSTSIVIEILWIELK